MVILIAILPPLVTPQATSAGPLLFQSELVTTGLIKFNYDGGAVAVSNDGSTALVAARGYNNFSGLVTVFILSGGAWIKQATLSPTDLTTGDAFGTSVAISGDGNTALIGTPYKTSSSGVAYVFSRSGAAWSQSAVLAAPTVSAGDSFGASVALSRDGSTAAVGVPNRASGILNEVGAVAIFTRTGNGPFAAGPVLTPSDGAAYDNFGAVAAVNTDGSTVVVGAAAKANNTGAAYVFARSGTTYTGASLAVSLTTGDYFGASVAVSASGGTIIVGAPRTTVRGNTSAGAAYLFTGSGTSYAVGGTFTAADGQRDDQYGSVVAVGGNFTLTDDAALLAISAPYRNSNVGAVYPLAHGSGATYTPDATLVGTYVAGTTQYTFGVGLSLSGDGTTAIIGAPGKNTNTGTAFAYNSAVAPPTITGISPASGPLSGGTPVTITGTNFEGGASVTFGGVAATGIKRISATQITAIVPISATSAAVDVVLTNGDGNSATLTGGYEYVLPNPTPTHIAHATVIGTKPVSAPPPRTPAPTEMPLTPTPIPAPMRR